MWFKGTACFFDGCPMINIAYRDVVVLGKNVFFKLSAVHRSKEEYFFKIWVCCLIYLIPLSILILDCCLYSISFLSQSSLFLSHFGFDPLVFDLSYSFKTSSFSPGASSFLKDLK